MKRLSGFIKGSLALLALAALFIPGGCAATNKEGFAIYLTGDNIRPDQMAAQSHFELADQPIIATPDIISYESATHAITLTAEAFARISNLQVPTTGKSFVVCVDKKPIYWGAFWTPISSQAFVGVTIWQWRGTEQSNTIKLELGYPSQNFYQGIDPRGNTEIMQALEKAGKLTTASELLPRSMKGYELYSWQREGVWNFTLITGTNRNKTLDEIVYGDDIVSDDGWVRIHVMGADAVKNVIGKIPRGEWVLWLGELREPDATGAIAFSLPDVLTVTAIEEYAQQCGLNFSVA